MVPENCIFCKIARGDIPGDIVHEDEDCVAFRDINPQAPTHVLVIPRKHVEGLAETEPEDQELLGKLAAVAAKVAEQEGLNDSGYRVVINWGEDAGMGVPHLHLHVLGGRRMSWPPG